MAIINGKYYPDGKAGDEIARLNAVNAQLESGHKHMCDAWLKNESINCALVNALQAVIDRYAPTTPPANDSISQMWHNARTALSKATGE